MGSIFLDPPNNLPRPPDCEHSSITGCEEGGEQGSEQGSEKGGEQESEDSEEDVPLAHGKIARV